jgi:hypothetical protein
MQQLVQALHVFYGSLRELCTYYWISLHWLFCANFWTSQHLFKNQPALTLHLFKDKHALTLHLFID